MVHINLMERHLKSLNHNEERRTADNNLDFVVAESQALKPRKPSELNKTWAVCQPGGECSPNPFLLSFFLLRGSSSGAIKSEAAF